MESSSLAWQWWLEGESITVITFWALPSEIPQLQNETDWEEKGT